MTRARPAPTAILVAMFTRSAPLILATDGRTGFVRGWGSRPIRRSTVDALRRDGLIAADDSARRVFVLTDAGRARAHATLSADQREASAA